jgi:hypothetical protein
MRDTYGRGTGWGASRRCAILFPVVACATSAFAAVLSGSGASDRIPAGRVEVVALEPAMAGVEERELVLSLDGGKTFPVRLTGEIGPGDRAASWRVPALPTEHAVLALREGGDGIEEEIVAVSAEFVIVPGPGVPAEELRLRDGEWKTREADAGCPGLPPPAFGTAGPGRWTPLEDSGAAFEEPVRPLPAGPEALAVPGRGPKLETLPGASTPRPRVSSFLPLLE